MLGILKHYFSPLNTFMRKGKDWDPDPVPMIRTREAQKHLDPQHWLTQIQQVKRASRDSGYGSLAFRSQVRKTHPTDTVHNMKEIPYM